MLVVLAVPTFIAYVRQAFEAREDAPTPRVETTPRAPPHFVTVPVPRFFAFHHLSRRTQHDE
jgi:hypothetical protein